MMTSYWSRITSQRLRRRQAIRGALSLGAGGAALGLIGCGSSSSGTGPTNGGGPNGTAGEPRTMLPPLLNRSSEAVRGGTLRTVIGNSVTLDPITGQHGGFKVQNSPLFNRLFQTEPGILEPSVGNIIGDAADDWEMSPDGLQLTINLRHDLGTDPRPPVDGRMLDAQDVIWSWDLFAAESTVRATLLNDIDPNSPVTSVTAPDEHTVVFNLAFPSVLLEGYLADGFYFWIIPREAEDRYDRRNEAHGAGPWYNDVFEPDVQFRMVRNPNYYDADLPYLETLEVPVLNEPSAILAQFETGTLDITSTVYNSTAINNENVLDVFQRHPEMTLFAVPGTGSGRHIRVGFADGSPYRDIRMRQALSMMMNRADLAEYFTNAERLTEAGLPTEAFWVSHLAPIYPVALDIRDDAFAASRPFYEFNVEEAHRLMDAAGWSGEAIDFFYSSGAATERDGNVVAEQLRQAGVEVSERILDVNQEFVPLVVRQRGDYEGVALHLMLEGFGPEHYIYTNLHPSPETSAIRRPEDFPELTSISNAILSEFDANRRAALINEWMVQAAADMPSIPMGAVGPTYQLAWPWLANVGVYQRWLGSLTNNLEVFRHYWYDASKDTRSS